LHQQRTQVDLRLRAREHADHAQRAAQAQRANALCDGLRAAHLEHVVCTLTIAELSRWFAEVCALGGVDAVLGAERRRPLELLRAAAGDDDSHPERLGDAETRERHAAGAEADQPLPGCM